MCNCGYCEDCQAITDAEWETMTQEDRDSVLLQIELHNISTEEAS